MIKSITKRCAIAALCLSSMAASAYDNMFVFGDSLSDNGNLHALNAQAPVRFTNGPVAAEVVAAQLGLSLTPSYHLLQTPPFGNNYAIAGAKAVDDDGDESTPDINLPTQVNAFLQIHGGVAPKDSLYVVLIGGNDIRAARAIRSAGVLADSKEARNASRKAARDSIAKSVDSEKKQIMKLIAAGAKNIVVINAPDIGAIPETELVTLQTAAAADNKGETRRANRIPFDTTKLSAIYNRKLDRKIGQIESQTGINIIEYDLFTFLTEQVDDAEAFGYSNTDEACIWVFSQAGAVNPDCTDFPVATGFLFWDEIHPTAIAHQRAAAGVLEALLKGE